MSSSEHLLLIAASSFEAARKVEILEKNHPSRRLHGHSFHAKLRVEIDPDDNSRNGTEVESLYQRLKDCVAELDYKFLNDYLSVPTDENLARWISHKMLGPYTNSIGIQSTQDQGVDLDANQEAHVWRRFRFEAAHQLPNVPSGHQCGRMHGHGFEVILHSEQNISGQQLSIDYDRLGELWLPIYKLLNHSCLNNIEGLQNPTSEVLCHWLWNRLKPLCESLSWVSVYETSTAGCHFNGSDYRIWKEQRFESALRLDNAPMGDPRRNLHGHSYLVRLHLTAPLDRVMGWTVDYGDVKKFFKPAYEQLDHHLISDVSGIESEGSVSIARWIKARVYKLLPELDRIDIYEKPGCGVVLSWGEESPILPV
ncbi:6-pyruvoyl trahydropterin synthase family protein [Methylophaga pinxianii]|uniref:6-pyruvoyl trahydropterin synthase family protein n=1 Tax=Methylophaga pinxianii TaxID=2881052 RepID=UPI001CF25A5C|nr:6-carboxytetrahydropterin synthase [Methylophaga pinxianii]MCB2427121.1 6-carboxytetrahydropterin synthase [Methylophaga pinxianii]UPH44976.1 6-carboxytetrahydropterin synthase [Methylophaga pinxianii]